MPGIFAGLTGGSGPLTSLSQGSGPLAKQAAVLRSRVSAFQMGATPQAKVQALVQTAGTRLKSMGLGGLLQDGGGILNMLKGGSPSGAAVPPPAQDAVNLRTDAALPIVQRQVTVASSFH